jgi:hypothetical protein
VQHTHAAWERCTVYIVCEFLALEVHA